ncbi:Crp/Fnr family transcriptional regulator [Thiolapillus brandeum]|uniref:Crp/FNR family transcriptional regulator n=1 Tax=Thiolapillus brandeum TaxID=1076588 RepID=A0A7U6JIJ6_9GAMM|nr:Crp/Fnr family transcriptional regulator [Thiolapillus brandeum]BAO44932.1 Crp/FNR family transcriptional regulator [Thiolapillus brandeum]
MTDIDPGITLPDYFPEVLTQRSKYISLEKGERLFLTGDKVMGIYYVIEGELKALRSMMEGTEVVMMRSEAGNYFGESALAIDTYVCDALCTKSARVMFLPREALTEAMKDLSFVTGFTLSLAKNVRRQCSRYERLRLKKSKDRLLHFLTCESDDNGEINWHSSLIEFAAELAIEPETLYRILAELEREGSIERNKRQIKLLKAASH